MRCTTRDERNKLTILVYDNVLHNIKDKCHGTFAWKRNRNWVKPKPLKSETKNFLEKVQRKIWNRSFPLGARYLSASAASGWISQLFENFWAKKVHDFMMTHFNKGCHFRSWWKKSGNQRSFNDESCYKRDVTWSVGTHSSAAATPPNRSTWGSWEGLVGREGVGEGGGGGEGRGGAPTSTASAPIAAGNCPPVE